MRFRMAVPALLAWVLFAGALRPAEAQRQRFKIGGGAGFASLANPDISLGWTFGLGGFFGYRVNDNVSIESGFNFGRSNRTFNANGVPVDQSRDLPAFRFESERYQLDGSFVYNFGPRQPFHPFLLAGGTFRRRSERQTDFIFEPDPETGLPVLVDSVVVLDETTYEPTGHIGAGAEIYFMYNLAARAEYRLWIPKDWSRRTQLFLFSASFYF